MYSGVPVMRSTEPEAMLAICAVPQSRSFTCQRRLATKDRLGFGVQRPICVHQLQREQLFEPLMSHEQHLPHATCTELLDDIVATADDMRSLLGRQLDFRGLLRERVDDLVELLIVAARQRRQTNMRRCTLPYRRRVAGFGRVGACTAGGERVGGSTF